MRWAVVHLRVATGAIECLAERGTFLDAEGVGAGRVLMMPPHLTPREVAELAEILSEFPRRTGFVARVMDAAEQGQGIDLRAEEMDVLLSRVRALRQRVEQGEQVPLETLRALWEEIVREGASPS